MAESAPDVRDEILAVFPELAQARAEDLVSAAYVVRASEARVFHVRSAPGA
jgi:hypothetical protein